MLCTDIGAHRAPRQVHFGSVRRIQIRAKRLARQAISADGSALAMPRPTVARPDDVRTLRTTKCTAPDGAVRPHYRAVRRLARAHAAATASRRSARRPSARSIASASRSRCTARTRGTERLIPFDIVPRIIPGDEWDDARARAEAARARAQRVPRRHLPRPAHPRRRARFRAERVLGNAQYRARDARAWTCPAASTRTSPASTSCARATASSTCSRTTCACPRACRTCSRTAR